MRIRIHRTRDGFWAVTRGIERIAVLLTWRDAIRYVHLVVLSWKARVTRDGEFWTVTFDGTQRGRFRYWHDAIRHACVVTAQSRRGEPTA